MVQVEAVSFLRHMGCNPSDGRPTQPDTVPVAEVHSKVLARAGQDEGLSPRQEG